ALAFHEPALKSLLLVSMVRQSLCVLVVPTEGTSTSSRAGSLARSLRKLTRAALAAMGRRWAAVRRRRALSRHTDPRATCALSRARVIAGAPFTLTSSPNLLAGSTLLAARRSERRLSAGASSGESMHR